MYNFDIIRKQDNELADAMAQELNRQRTKIELIASENFVSPAVIEAMGSPLTNKYAEGYPGKRYYGGCEYVDIVEQLAIDRAKEVFGAEFANVQPHSGASANLAVFFATMQPGDTYMGMSLAEGGHLSHGSPVNISGKYFNCVPYGLDPVTETIDYDNMEKLALEHKPKLILAGASAYSREIDFKRVREICDKVGAYMMVDIAHIAGLVATGLHPSPVPYADFVTTTTHKTLRGPRGGLILCKEKYGKMINSAIFPGCQGGPLMHVIAAKAVCFKEALSEDFVKYQTQIKKNAKALCDALLNKGIKIVSGGTDNHLMLVNLIGMDITGKELEHRLDEVGITCNKNAVPNDPASPFITSGIRLGTPAVTSRGMVEEDMEEIADLIYLTISDFENSKEEIRNRVDKLCKKYPLYE